MKTQTTITEALAELKTLDKRIESTRDFVLKYAVRQGSTIDPLDDEGGSDKVIPAKMQSLADLLERKVQIRAAINKANATTFVEITGVRRSVADWIIWRRESFKQELDAYTRLQAHVLAVRNQCLQKGMTLKDDGNQPARVQEVACFVRESAIQKRIESLNEVESVLDGKLSLVNATTGVTI